MTPSLTTVVIWRRLAPVAGVALALVMVVSMAAVIVAHTVQTRLDDQINRIDDVFVGLDDRPEKPASGTAAKALNILVMGTDRRSEVPTTGTAATAAEWIPGAQRTDTIMVLHVDGDRQGASLVSIPRDSWVDVPGHGTMKVNAAFSLGGPSLAVETIEQLTDLRIDHLAVIDWAGFQSLIDSVDGVDVTVPRTITDPHLHVVWVRGRQHLDGSQAMLYVRQRYGLPRGDLDRVRRQQAVLRALFRSSLHTLRSKRPWAVYELLDTVTRTISVDDSWSFAEMRDLVLDLRSLPAGDLDLITVPVRGLGYEGAQSVVYLDLAGGRDLWSHVRDDRVGDWVDRHRAAAVTGPVP